MLVRFQVVQGRILCANERDASPHQEHNFKAWFGGILGGGFCPCQPRSAGAAQESGGKAVCDRAAQDRSHYQGKNALLVLTSLHFWSVSKFRHTSST